MTTPTARSGTLLKKKGWSTGTKGIAVLVAENVAQPHLTFFVLLKTHRFGMSAESFFAVRDFHRLRRIAEPRKLLDKK